MIQFDYPSGGIGRKERKKYTFSNFRGVDTSVAKINVDPSRAVESTNFVDRDGALHKRFGWEQIYQFDGAINGFWKLNLDGKEYQICYSVNRFFILTDNGWQEAYTNKNLVSRRTRCYTQGKKAYFIGCGDFIVFRFNHKEGKYSFFSVVDDNETFIPITTAQILPTSYEEDGVYGRYVRDGVNLLTGWRKNTLVGKVVPENGHLIYRLDSKPTLQEGVNAYVTLLNTRHELSSLSNNTVYPAENDDVKNLIIYTTPMDLTDESVTELVNPKEGELNYPDIAYDAIPVDGEFSKDWVVRIECDKGVAGLRWKRESGGIMVFPHAQNQHGVFRVYTLYFCGDSQSDASPIPLVRRVYESPHTKIYSCANTEYAISHTVKSRIDDESILVNITVIKKSEEIKEDELAVTLQSTVSGDGSVNNETKIVTVPAGQMSVSIETNFYCRKDLTFSISALSARRIVDCPLSLVSLSNLKHYEVIVRLPELKEKQITVSDYVKGETASISMIKENYLKVMNFSSATLSSTAENDNFSAYIDNLGNLVVEKWGIDRDYQSATIDVEFFVNSDKSKLITQSQYSTLYGVDGATDRLFVSNSGEKEYSNLIIFSELDDFTYFPDSFTKTIGGIANEVKGFLRLANGSMAALKSYSMGEATVFVFSGDYINGYYDADNKEPYTLPRFSTSGVALTQGAISGYALDNLADDSLFLSQNGVYALELSQGTDSQRFAKERSLPINAFLKECNSIDLENAVAITYKNKYYLAVKHYKQTLDEHVVTEKNYYEKQNGLYVLVSSPDENRGMQHYYEEENLVYIADAHYTFLPDGAMSDAPSYEWYPLDNMPVYMWFILDEELYFGTEDGRVCRVESEGFADIKKQYFATNISDKKVKELSQSLAKAISVNADGFNSDFDNDGKIDTFSIDEHVDVVDGDTLVFLSGEILSASYDEPENFLYKELMIQRLYVEGEFKGIQLKNEPGGSVLQFVKAENLVVEIRRKENVKAKRVLPTFAFGMPDYLKTLESFTVVMNGVEGGEMSMDIITRSTAESALAVEGQTRFNMLEGFNTRSFNVPFQNAYTKTVAIRNFNYMSVKILNQSATDCSVSSISFMYKYNTRGRGVM